MNKDQQAEFDKCYRVWPATRRKRGVAEASWEKKKPPPEFFEWILARNRYCRAANYSDQYRRLFSTAINQKAWKDDIPSHSDIRKSNNSPKAQKYVTPVKKRSKEEIERANQIGKSQIQAALKLLR